MDKTSKKTKNKKLPFEDDISIENYRRGIMQESDRGCAIVGVTLLDEFLMKLLIAKFKSDNKIYNKAIKPLFSSIGPLSSLGARTKLAYALGLIDNKDYENINCLRKIRNDFAHNVNCLSFDHPEISKKINKLDCPVEMLKEPDIEKFMMEALEENSTLPEDLEKYTTPDNYCSRERVLFLHGILLVFTKLGATLYKLIKDNATKK